MNLPPNFTMKVKYPCNCCQTMIFTQGENDSLCDKCEEFVSLRIKVERYEKALKEIASSPFGDTSCNEIAIKYEIIADKALCGEQRHTTEKG